MIRTPVQKFTSEDFHELSFFLEMDLVSTRDTYPTIFPELKSVLYPEISNKFNIDPLEVEQSVNLYTSHACPNRCGYCCSSAFLEKIYGKSSAFALDAYHIYTLVLEYVRKRGVQFISFWDDDFCSSRSRVKTFCELVIEGKKKKDIPPTMKFQCQTRVLAFRRHRETDFEILDLMRQAGFILISLGVENFSQRLLNTPVMNKFGYNADIAMDVIKAVDSSRICPSINFMICVPETSPDEILFNIDKLIELQKMFVSVNIGFYIDSYPGSCIYKDDNYPTLKKNIYNPLTHSYFTKEGYLIPHNSDVRKALNYYMEKGVKLEIETLESYLGNDFPIKKDIYLMNLLKCRAMAKTLPKSENIMQKLSAMIEKRCKRVAEILSYGK